MTFGLYSADAELEKKEAARKQAAAKAAATDTTAAHASSAAMQEDEDEDEAGGSGHASPTAGSPQPSPVSSRRPSLSADGGGAAAAAAEAAAATSVTAAPAVSAASSAAAKDSLAAVPAYPNPLPLPTLIGGKILKSQRDFQLPYDIWFQQKHGTLKPLPPETGNYTRLRCNVYVDVPPPQIYSVGFGLRGVNFSCSYFCSPPPLLPLHCSGATR